MREGERYKREEGGYYNHLMLIAPPRTPRRAVLEHQPRLP